MSKVVKHNYEKRGRKDYQEKKDFCKKEKEK